VVHNLICSRAVPEIVRENGGTPVRTRVGHSFIKGVMAETDAIFGGEHSAHYYFRDNWRADSGIIAAMIVLEQLSKAGVPLSEFRLPFERYADSGEVNRRVTDPHAVIEEVAAAFPDARQDRLDGLTVEYDDWWFNLRPSNTEPLLRLKRRAADAAMCESAPVGCSTSSAARQTDQPAAGNSYPRRTAHHPHETTHTGDPVALDPSCSRSWRAPRTRARCCTSPTRTRSTTRACTGVRDPRRHPDHAGRRGRGRRRRRARPPGRQGGRRGHRPHVRG